MYAKHLLLFMVVLLAGFLCASAAPKPDKKPAGKDAKGAKASARSGFARSAPKGNETKQSSSGSDAPSHSPSGTSDFDPTIPINIKDEDVKGVQDSISDSLTSIQTSLMDFISGLFDAVKSLVQQGSGKAVDLVQDSINRTNAVNTKVMSWGTDLSDIFSQSLKNVSKLGEDVLNSASFKAKDPKEKKDKKDKKH